MPPRAGTSYPDTWRIPDLSEPRYSQSLERGLAILECFTPETPVLGIADIADAAGHEPLDHSSLRHDAASRSGISDRERSASIGSGCA